MVSIVKVDGNIATLETVNGVPEKVVQEECCGRGGGGGG